MSTTVRLCVLQVERTAVVFTNMSSFLQLAYLREQGSQKRGLADGTSEVNHSSENTPSTNGKVSPRLSQGVPPPPGHQCKDVWLLTHVCLVYVFNVSCSLRGPRGTL